MTPSPNNLTIAGELMRAHWLLKTGTTRGVEHLHHVWENQASPGLYTSATARTATDDVADGWQYARGWHDRRQRCRRTIDSGYCCGSTGYAGVSRHRGRKFTGRHRRRHSTELDLANPSLSPPSCFPVRSIAWKWDGHVMHVTLKGPNRKIEFGPAFPPGTTLTITHEPLPG